MIPVENGQKKTRDTATEANSIQCIDLTKDLYDSDELPDLLWYQCCDTNNFTMDLVDLGDIFTSVPETITYLCKNNLLKKTYTCCDEECNQVKSKSSDGIEFKPVFHARSNLKFDRSNSTRGIEFDPPLKMGGNHWDAAQFDQGGIQM